MDVRRSGGITVVDGAQVALGGGGRGGEKLGIDFVHDTGDLCNMLTSVADFAKTGAGGDELEAAQEKGVAERGGRG